MQLAFMLVTVKQVSMDYRPKDTVLMVLEGTLVVHLRKGHPDQARQ